MMADAREYAGGYGSESDGGYYFGRDPETINAFHQSPHKGNPVCETG